MIFKVHSFDLFAKGQVNQHENGIPNSIIRRLTPQPMEAHSLDLIHPSATYQIITKNVKHKMILLCTNNDNRANQEEFSFLKATNSVIFYLPVLHSTHSSGCTSGLSDHCILLASDHDIISLIFRSHIYFTILPGIIWYDNNEKKHEDSYIYHFLTGTSFPDVVSFVCLIRSKSNSNTHYWKQIF